MRRNVLNRIHEVSCLALIVLAAVGCQKKPAPAPAAAGGMQAMPVQTVAVSLAPVAAKQRVCGHHQVAPLGHPAAAGERTADRDSASAPATT